MRKLWKKEADNGALLCVSYVLCHGMKVGSLCKRLRKRWFSNTRRWRVYSIRICTSGEKDCW